MLSFIDILLSDAASFPQADLIRVQPALTFFLAKVGVDY